jgi:hypothetical protein
MSFSSRKVSHKANRISISFTLLANRVINHGVAKDSGIMQCPYKKLQSLGSWYFNKSLKIGKIA